MAAVELRCEAKMHAILDDGVIKVKCNSRFCGAKRGVIIIHHFSALSGNLLETKRYKDPTTQEGGERDGAGNNGTAVRSA